MTHRSAASRRGRAATLLALALSSFAVLPMVAQGAPAGAKADKGGPGAGPAGYPTTDRVEFVIDCMRSHGGAQEYLYKCSCVVDGLARRFTYEQFVDGSSVNRYREMGGERMSEFRDPPSARKSGQAYRDALDEASRTCGIAR